MIVYQTYELIMYFYDDKIYRVEFTACNELDKEQKIRAYVTKYRKINKTWITKHSIQTIKYNRWWKDGN